MSTASLECDHIPRFDDSFDTRHSSHGQVDTWRSGSKKATLSSITQDFPESLLNSSCGVLDRL